MGAMEEKREYGKEDRRENSRIGGIGKDTGRDMDVRGMDVQSLQEKWQKRWNDAKLFEAIPDPEKKKHQKKYWITIPYPYISGSLHIGHGRVVTEADVFSRYLRMSGNNVLYPIAFHITGTPVLGISMSIKNRDPDKMELYRNYVRAYISDEAEVEKIVLSFEEPWNIVNFFIPKMINEFSKLGLAVDWRRTFTSGDVEHQKLVEWQFNKYKEQDYLVQGKYPVLYSVEAESAAGEDDIIDGDINPVEKQDFVLLKFKMPEASRFKGMYMVAATLRPETMYGQTNMWANPDVTYVHATVDNEEWIISKECASKLQYQDHIITVREDIPAKELIGGMCRNEAIQRDLPILPGPFCDPKIGTGIVTSVPSDAPFDWIALKEVQDNCNDAGYCKRYNLAKEKAQAIKLIPIIKSEGYGDFPAVEICERMKITSLKDEQKLEEATQEIYKIGFHTGVMREVCGQYTGMKVVWAKQEMKEKLLKEKLAGIMYETSRQAKHRGGGDIIVAVLDGQWFLDFNAKGWKAKATHCLNKMTIVPDKYRKQFEDTFDWLEKRPCARKRGIGTPLPFNKEWIIESLSDSTIYMNLYLINHILKSHNIKGEQLTLEFFDHVMLGKGDVKTVAKNTEIPEHALAEMRTEVEYWMPQDHRHTFTAHLSNHLSFFIFAHAAIYPERHWPKKITFHGMVISEGAKMSKSKGNTISLQEVYGKYGSDSFRAFMCNSTSVESTFNWDTKEVERMRSHLNNIAEVISSMAARHLPRDEFLQNIFLEHKNDPKSFSMPARAFLSRFQRAVTAATEAIEAMNLRLYSTAVLYDIFNYYKSYINTNPPKEELLKVHALVAVPWTRMLTPLVPHYAEELHELLGEKGFASISHWPISHHELLDKRAEALDDMLSNVRSDIRRVMDLAKIDHPQQIILIISDDWKYALYEAVSAELTVTRNISDIQKTLMQTHLKRYGMEIGKMLPKLVTSVPTVILTPQEEYDALDNAKQSISALYDGADIIIKKAADAASEPKAKNASPGKPAIIIS